MKRNWNNLKIAKDILRRKYFIQKELKIIISKSLLQNQNIKPLVRAYIKITYLTKITERYVINKQQNRCLLTGKAKSTFKLSGFARQNSRALIESGLLQNIKAQSY